MCTKKEPITVVHEEYSVLRMLLVMNHEELNGLKAVELSGIREKIAALKRCIFKTFQDYYGERPFTERVHLLPHLTDDQERFARRRT